MIILLVLLIAIVFSILRGGRFTNLSTLHFRWSGLVIFGFLIQVVIFSSFWQEKIETRSLTAAVYLVSLLTLLAALATNYRIAGMRLIILGFLLNFAAIALNGGYMPVLPAARAISGQSELGPGQIANNVIGARPDTRFIFLGDIFSIPKGFPFPNVFSVGDVLIALGAAYLIYQALTNPDSSPQSSSLDLPVIRKPPRL